MTSTGDVVIHSWIDGRKRINIYNQDGQIIETHPSPHICTRTQYNTKEKDQSGCMAALNINNTEYICTSCPRCGIFLLNRHTGSFTHAFENQCKNPDQRLPTKSAYTFQKLLHVFKYTKPDSMTFNDLLPYPAFVCMGPDWRLLTCSGNSPHLIHVYDYSNPGSITLKEQITFPDEIESKSTGRLCYDESSVPGGLVIVTHYDIHYIAAMSLKTQQLVWRVQGEVLSKVCDPWGVTTDGMGRIYVADGDNGRVLILRASDGLVIQVLDLGLYFIGGVAWRPTQPHLMMYCRPEKGDEPYVHLFNVE